MNNPNPKLNTPAKARTAIFVRANEPAVRCSGKLKTKLINIIPPIEPMPKMAMTANASHEALIVASKTSNSPALPAKP